MGGPPRYEQLYRATGWLAIDGRRRQDFTGTGLRIRRQGGPQARGFLGGHTWQSAVFPSGKAFGYIAYPPRPDGQPTYNEGYLFSGDGALIPARVVEAPWLTRLQALGEDVSLVLATADGTVRIEGGRRCSRPTTSTMTTTCTPCMRSSRRCRAFRRFSRPVCVTDGTASRPTGCSSVPTRSTRSHGREPSRVHRTAAGSGRVRQGRCDRALRSTALPSRRRCPGHPHP